MSGESRLQRRRQRDRERRERETPDERENRLQHRRQRYRERRERETPDERESRLQHQRERDRERRERETPDERESRLQHQRERDRERRERETPDERESRLQHQRECDRERRERETPDERESRLQHQRESDRERRERETPDERESRVQHQREYIRERRESLRETPNERGTSTISRVPLFDQQSVRNKMAVFHAKMNKCTFNHCITCNESFPSLQVSESGQCTRCSRDKRTCKLYSSDNGMDPGPVPPQLQGLTQVEEMLISAIMPIMTVYRLPQGQYGYRGHVVNLPQQIEAFATSLPRLPSDLDVVIVRKEGSDNRSHKDFRVRRSKVLCALEWLQHNNIYYRNIYLNQYALSQLPEDGDLIGISTVTLPENEEVVSSPVTEELDDPTFMPGSFVPMNVRRNTEQEIIQQTVAETSTAGTSNQPLSWPQIGHTPINEFETEGYFTSAFPVLFPTGAADFAAPRVHKVTIGYYFRHLMMYKDNRFATHPRFRYFALNTEMRWRALQAGRIYIRQHPHEARLTVQELRDMIGNEGATFSNSVLHFASSLRGTQPYWYKQRSRLVAMVDNLGLPTVFFTHSAADAQWPELANLICTDDPHNRTNRNRALNSNPAVADWFFYHRILLFLKHFYVDVLKAKDYWLRFEWQHRGSPHVHGVAWLSDAPDIQQLQACSSTNLTQVTDVNVINYIDSIISTINPAVSLDGDNISEAPPPQTDPHICHKPYAEIEDFQQDLIALIATCRNHGNGL